jgi:hypothetical protein
MATARAPTAALRDAALGGRKRHIKVSALRQAVLEGAMYSARRTQNAV